MLFTDKEKLKIAGLMSGTSCDGLDIAVISLDQETGKHELIECSYIPYPNNLRRAILGLINQLSADFELIKEIETDLSIWYAEQVNKLETRQIDLIGMHGQTIFYRSPAARKMGLSWQLGSVSHVAKLSGIHCVGDFRNGDIALMGNGAPLAPFYDFDVYNNPEINQLALNIGGISNGTYLKKDCWKDDVIAFDFGPGNCLIDMAMQELFDKPYDQAGEIALSGKIDDDLITTWIESDNYFLQKPPKATGREYYNQQYLNNLLKSAKRNGLDNKSIIASLTAFTVRQICYQLGHFSMDIDELIITGGGYKNKMIM
ncbi:MAG: anhydro-N-acetylmuramic acid kinase, partial [Calditrichaeota bacterium]|nr:anhydro-N-acetylmuramic acid kinase [Calditrichota bacterium]